MTHGECLATLRGRLNDHAPDATPSTRWDEAERHLVHCSDCWTVLEHLCERITGMPAPTRERARALFACEHVRERFHELVTLAPMEMEVREPDATRHLRWCHACRSRFAELIAVEELVATRAAERHPQPLSASWSRIGTRLAIGVQRGFAAFTRLGELAVPAGVAEPVALRGEGTPDRTYDGPALARGVDVIGATGAVDAELRVRPSGEDRVDLEVRLPSAPLGALVTLYTLASDRTELAACRSTDASGGVVLQALPLGTYVLELPTVPVSAVALAIDSLPS